MPSWLRLVVIPIIISVIGLSAVALVIFFLERLKTVPPPQVVVSDRLPEISISYAQNGEFEALLQKYNPQLKSILVTIWNTKDPLTEFFPLRYSEVSGDSYDYTYKYDNGELKLDIRPKISDVRQSNLDSFIQQQLLTLALLEAGQQKTTDSALDKDSREKHPLYWQLLFTKYQFNSSRYVILKYEQQII